MNEQFWSYLGVLATLGLFIGTPQRAEGSAQDLFGFGVVCPGMANACLTRPQGIEGAYYNPAGLSGVKEKTVSFSYMSAFYGVKTSGLGEAASSHTDLTRSGGLAFGAAVPLPLPLPVGKAISFGIGMYIPDESLIRAQIPSPGTPWYPVIGNRANTLGVQAGIAVAPTRWLHLGLGVKVLAELVGEIGVSPGPTGILASTIRDELQTTLSPLAGITVFPFSEVRFSVVYRGEERGAFSLPIRADLGDEFPLQIPEVTIEGLAQYDPQQSALGVRWEPHSHFSVEWNVQWRNWSAYPTPITNATPAASPQEPPKFSDTFSPRMGVEGLIGLSPSASLAYRGGYGYEPSPAPEQNAANNHLDSDRHVLGVGFGLAWEFGDRSSLQIDAFFQEHLLVERTHTKPSDSDDTPKIGPMTTQGMIHVMGMGLQVGFP